jgi:hypothetical protein
VQVDELMSELHEKKVREAAKQAAEAYSPTSGAWICKGLVVKVMADQLKDYYKKKGEIVGVVDQYVAEVEMLDSGDVLRIDQAQLETVCKLPTPRMLPAVVTAIATLWRQTVAASARSTVAGVSCFTAVVHDGFRVCR